MIRKLALATAIIIVSLPFLSCSSPTLTPNPTLTPKSSPEPTIPTNFSTYTKEGLFSISYPLDWVPATSIMEDVMNQLIEARKAEGQGTAEGANLLFLGGVPTANGYFPNVNVVVVPRSTGFWTLDEVVEAESQYNRENRQGYRVYAQVKTINDGIAAVIIDSEVYDGVRTVRFLQLFTVKDNYVWQVTCTTNPDDFKSYESTLYSVVRSLRILE